MQELRGLPNKRSDAYVFEGRGGRPQDIRTLWLRVCTEAGLKGRTFQALRHSCGHALATAGIGQAGIMQVMGHRSLAASARYVHANPADKLRIVRQRNARKRPGAAVRARQRREQADEVRVWLYPWLFDADQYLKAVGYKQRGWQGLFNACRNLGMDEFTAASFVTEKRVQDWNTARRPICFSSKNRLAL